MGYGLIGLKQKMEGQALNSFSKVADEQAANKRAKDALDAADKQQTMSMAGTGAAMGFMVGGPVGAAIGGAIGYVAGDLF